MEAIIRSAVGASQVSPARKRWDNGSKKSTAPEVRRTPLFQQHQTTRQTKGAPRRSNQLSVTFTPLLVTPFMVSFTAIAPVGALAGTDFSILARVPLLCV